MKKVSKISKTNELLIDVVEYTFTEWLIRQGIYTAFRSNYRCSYKPGATFRDRLRGLIRRSLFGPGFGPKHLITSAFLFASAPEGVAFWGKQSAAWERFCAEFQLKF